jgi:hypothetical protein
MWVLNESVYIIGWPQRSGKSLNSSPSSQESNARKWFDTSILALTVKAWKGSTQPSHVAGT